MIKIIAVGKIKEKFYNDAICEYLKRLSSYTKISIVQVQDEKDSDISKQKEAENILKNIKETDYVISLEINGEKLSSEELANFIDKRNLEGNSNLVFVIGGSLGLEKSVINRANYHLSFSKMTFPHQLMRVILLEQIYRAYKIIKGEPYHK